MWKPTLYYLNRGRGNTPWLAPIQVPRHFTLPLHRVATALLERPVFSHKRLIFIRHISESTLSSGLIFFHLPIPRIFLYLSFFFWLPFQSILCTTALEQPTPTTVFIARYSLRKTNNSFPVAVFYLYSVYLVFIRSFQFM